MAQHPEFKSPSGSYRKPTQAGAQQREVEPLPQAPDPDWSYLTGPCRANTPDLFSRALITLTKSTRDCCPLGCLQMALCGRSVWEVIEGHNHVLLSHSPLFLGQVSEPNLEDKCCQARLSKISPLLLCPSGALLPPGLA